MLPELCAGKYFVTEIYGAVCYFLGANSLS